MSDRNQRLQRILEQYRDGRLDEAIHLAQQALQESPDEGRLWELRGLIHRDRSETAAAVDALERASLLVPLQTFSRIALAEGYGKLGRRELARDLYLECLKPPEPEVESLLHIGAGLEACGFPGLAMKACRLAQRSDPQHPQPYYDMGYYAARCGYPMHVVESLARRAISFDPENVHYRVGLASLLLRQDRLDDALNVIGAMTDRQIHAIRCRCCLERITELFEQTGDRSRAEQCRRHAQRLADDGIPSDCE